MPRPRGAILRSCLPTQLEEMFDLETELSLCIRNSSFDGTFSIGEFTLDFLIEEEPIPSFLEQKKACTHTTYTHNQSILHLIL